MTTSATSSRISNATSIVFFLCATFNFVIWSFLIAGRRVSKIRLLYAGPKQDVIGILFLAGSISLLFVAYSPFLQQDPSRPLVLPVTCLLSGVALWNEYIYLFAARFRYPLAAPVALTLGILSSVYKLTVSSLFFRDSMSAIVLHRLFPIVFLFSAIEGLFQATVYCKIWCRCVRAKSSSTSTSDIVKALVYRAPSTHKIRKAVWLAMIVTAISAILSSLLAILGSRSESMWISLTPLHSSAQCLIRLCILIATSRVPPPDFDPPFDLKLYASVFEYENRSAPHSDMEKGVPKVEHAKHSSINKEACDIVYPRGSIFELEKGDGIRKPGKEDTVKLKFSRIEINLTLGENLKSPSLLSALEENVQKVWVAHDGSFGKEKWKKLPEPIFAVVSRMTLGQKVKVVEKKADEDRTDLTEERGERATIYVIELLKIINIRLRIRVGCCACDETTGPGEGWECGICEHVRCPVCYFLTEWPAFHAAIGRLEKVDEERTTAACANLEINEEHEKNSLLRPTIEQPDLRTFEIAPAFDKAFNALLGCIDALRRIDLEPSAPSKIVQDIQLRFQSLLDILATPETFNTDWRDTYIRDLKPVLEYFIQCLEKFSQRYATLDTLADVNAETLSEFQARWPEIRDFILFYRDRIGPCSWKLNGIQRPRDLIRLQSEIENRLHIWWVQLRPILNETVSEEMYKKEKENLHQLLKQWRLIPRGGNPNRFTVTHSLKEGNLKVFLDFDSNFKWRILKIPCDTRPIPARPGNVSSTSSLKYRNSCLVVGKMGLGTTWCFTTPRRYMETRIVPTLGLPGGANPHVEAVTPVGSEP